MQHNSPISSIKAIFTPRFLPVWGLAVWVAGLIAFAGILESREAFAEGEKPQPSYRNGGPSSRAYALGMILVQAKLNHVRAVWNHHRALGQAGSLRSLDTKPVVDLTRERLLKRLDVYHKIRRGTERDDLAISRELARIRPIFKQRVRELRRQGDARVLQGPALLAQTQLEVLQAMWDAENPH